MKLNPKYLIPRSLRDKIRPAMKNWTYDHVLSARYRKAAKKPVDSKKVLFVELDRDDLNDSMRLVYDALRERGFTCDFLTLHLNHGKFSEYTRLSAQMAEAAATARLIILSDTCPPLACLPLRNETNVIQLWHACGAFKRFGMSTADKLFGSSREQKTRYPEHRNTSLVTVSSPEVVWAYEEAMCLEGKGVVRPLGVSRTDVYFDPTYIAARRAEAAAAIPDLGDKRILLYAPTFRGHVAQAQAPDALDVRLLREHLGNTWVFLIKHHPFVKQRPKIPADCADFAYDVSDALSIDACLCAADACITDYSSIVFEYSLFSRPMAFFAYDRADYDDWRGFYYDYDQMTPGPVFTTNNEIASWVVGLDSGFDPAEIDAFREKYMCSCDGHATERIVDAALALGE